MNSTRQLFEQWHASLDHGHLPWQASKEELYEAFEAGFASLISTAPAPAGNAEDIYLAYPRKVGRAAAIKAIEKALKNGVGYEYLKKKVEMYAAAVRQWPPRTRYTITGVDTVPHPATWFNQERWLDDEQEWKRGVPEESQFSTIK